MRAKRQYWPLLLLLATLGSWGESPVQASISAQDVVVGEIFNLAITVSGESVSEPDLQAVTQAGFTVGSPSQSSSTQISMINGRTTMVQSKSWRYPLRAGQPGTFTIPRISIKVDGKEYFTNPMQVKVSKDLPRQGANAARPNTRKDGSISIEELAFVEAATDKDTVFQGEAIRLNLRIFLLDDFGVGLEGPTTLPMPERPGFYTGPQTQQATHETRNGRNYRVTDINMTIYPTQSGPLTIGSWDWQGTVYWPNPRGFGNQSSLRSFHTAPISINVTPLPPPPPEFTGAVGKYHFKSNFPNAPLTQGVPFRWVLAVSGDGNLDSAGAPAMPTLAWAHVSGPEIDVQPGDNGEQSKLFSYTITPLERGEQKIPALSFAFFSPIIKNYKTETIQERTVTVQASTESTELVTAGGSQDSGHGKVELLNDGLSPIITELPAFRAPTAPLLVLPFYLTIFLIPPFLFCLYFFWMRHHRRLFSDRRYARKHQALSKCWGMLDRAATAEDPGELIYRAVTGFISDLLNAPEGGLTSAEIRQMLMGRSLTPELVDQVTELLRACERARYSGAILGALEADALSKDARMAVHGIREQLGKRIKQ